MYLITSFVSHDKSPVISPKSSAALRASGGNAEAVEPAAADARRDPGCLGGSVAGDPLPRGATGDPGALWDVPWGMLGTI